jgi:hypothetical protein
VVRQTFSLNKVERSSDTNRKGENIFNTINNDSFTTNDNLQDISIDGQGFVNKNYGNRQPPKRATLQTQGSPLGYIAGSQNNNILMKKNSVRGYHPKTGHSSTHRDSSYHGNQHESTVFSSIQIASGSNSKERVDVTADNSVTQVLMSQGATPLSATSNIGESVKRQIRLPQLDHATTNIQTGNKQSQGSKRHNLVLSSTGERLNICLPTDKLGHGGDIGQE